MSLKKVELIKGFKENILQSRIIQILTVCTSIIRATCKENLSFATIERLYITIYGATQNLNLASLLTVLCWEIYMLFVYVKREIF